MHIFLTHFPCVAYRHRVHAWLKEFAVRMSYLFISHSPFSCFIRFPCCSRTVTSSLGSCLHRKRGLSALPHERRGVWLLGRSRALHRKIPSLRHEILSRTHTTVVMACFFFPVFFVTHTTKGAKIPSREKRRVANLVMLAVVQDRRFCTTTNVTSPYC